jgi:hypothetical protein
LLQNFSRKLYSQGLDDCLAGQYTINVDKKKTLDLLKGGISAIN